MLFNTAAASDIIFSVFQNIYLAVYMTSKNEEEFFVKTMKLSVPMHSDLYSKSEALAKEIYNDGKKKFDKEKVVLGDFPVDDCIRLLKGVRTESTLVIETFLRLRTDTPEAAAILDIGFAEGATDEQMLTSISGFTSLSISSVELEIYHELFLNKISGKELISAFITIYEGDYALPKDLVDMYSPLPGVYKRWRIGAPLNLSPTDSITRVFEDAVMNYEQARTDLAKELEPAAKKARMQEVKMWFDIMTKSALLVDKMKTTSAQNSTSTYLPVHLRLTHLAEDEIMKGSVEGIEPGKVFSASPYVGVNAEGEDNE